MGTDLIYSEIYPDTAEIINCYVVTSTHWRDLQLKDALMVLHSLLREIDQDCYIEMCLDKEIREIIINTIDFKSGLAFTGSDLMYSIKSYLLIKYTPVILKIFEELSENFELKQKLSNFNEEPSFFDVPPPPELVFRIRNKIDQENRL
jgi:hypothetical protein